MRFTAQVVFPLLCTVGIAAQTGPADYIPSGGFVPDSETAVAVAEAVLIPVYGKKLIAAERPFKAKLKDEVWIVSGTLNCGSLRKDYICVGGTAEVQISKKDAHIISMVHLK